MSETCDLQFRNWKKSEFERTMLNVFELPPNAVFRFISTRFAISVPKACFSIVVFYK